MPSLHCHREIDVVISNPAVELVMGCCVLQQGLSRSPLHVEVVVEVTGKLNSGIILESRIELLQDVAESGILASIIQVEILHQLPCSSLETSDQVQHGLRLHGWEDVYYENEEYGETEYDYEAGEEFDGEAIYYQDDAASTAGLSQEDQHQQVEEYDEAFAAYVDARRRFNDNRRVVRRATWPQVLVLRHRLRQRDHPVGTKVRKEKGVVERITSRVHQDLLEKERSRLAVRLELVPTTACDVERMGIVLPNVNKRPAPSSASVESVAYDPMETGLVIFQDASGHERPDSAMLDPGASAYLSGYGPFEICGTSTQPWISSWELGICSMLS